MPNSHNLLILYLSPKISKFWTSAETKTDFSILFLNMFLVISWLTIVKVVENSKKIYTFIYLHILCTDSIKYIFIPLISSSHFSPLPLLLPISLIEQIFFSSDMVFTGFFHPHMKKLKAYSAILWGLQSVPEQ